MFRRLGAYQGCHDYGKFSGHKSPFLHLGPIKQWPSSEHTEEEARLRTSTFKPEARTYVALVLWFSGADGTMIFCDELKRWRWEKAKERIAPTVELSSKLSRNYITKQAFRLCPGSFFFSYIKLYITFFFFNNGYAPFGVFSLVYRTCMVAQLSVFIQELWKYKNHIVAGWVSRTKVHYVFAIMWFQNIISLWYFSAKTEDIFFYLIRLEPPNPEKIESSLFWILKDTKLMRNKITTEM